MSNCSETSENHKSLSPVLNNSRLSRRSSFKRRKTEICREKSNENAGKCAEELESSENGKIEVNKISGSGQVGEEIYEFIPDPNVKLPDIQIPNENFNGFKFCNGNEVVLSKNQIAQNSRIFNDFLTPSTSNFQRRRKFNYLKRKFDFRGFTQKEIDLCRGKCNILGILKNNLGGKCEGKITSDDDLVMPPPKRQKLPGNSNNRNIFEKYKKIVNSESDLGENLNFPGFSESLKDNGRFSIKVEQEKGFELRQEMVKNKLKYFDQLLENDEISMESSNFLGFSTSSRKPIEFSKCPNQKENSEIQKIVSKEASKKKLEYFDKLLENEEISMESSDFPGFFTSSGKPIEFSKCSNQKENSEIQKTGTKGTSKEKLQYFDKLLENEENSMESSNFPGFSTSSGKHLEFSKGANQKTSAEIQTIGSKVTLKKKLEYFDKLLENEEISMESLHFPGFSTSSGKPIKFSKCLNQKDNPEIQKIGTKGTSKEKLQYFDKLLENDEIPMENFNFPGFSTSLGKSLELTKNSNQKENPQIKKTTTQETSNKKLEYFDKLSENEEISMENVSVFGFSTTSRKPVELPKSSDRKENSGIIKITTQETSKKKLEYFNEMLGNDEFLATNLNFPKFSTTSTKLIGIPNKLNQKQNCDIKKISIQETSKKKLDFFDKLLENDGIPIENTNFPVLSKPSLQLNKPPTSTTSNLEKSGFSTASGKSFKLSNNALNKAYKIFKDIENETFPKEQELATNSTFVTPKPNHDTPNLITKKSAKKTLGTRTTSLKQIQISNEKLQRASLVFDEDLTGISPIKPLVKHSQNYTSTPLKNQQSITKTEIKESDIKKQFVREINETNGIESKSFVIKVDKCYDTNWIETLKFEREKLEKRLEVLRERERVLDQIPTIFDRKPNLGVLSIKKSSKDNRQSLRNYVKYKLPGSQHDESVDNTLHCVTPQNAHLFHFKISEAFIKTQDGAYVIPNVDDVIGLKEIEHCFENSPGVEPNLIPRNWIRNHYKFILWKFACYQRTFPREFYGVLCPEGVMEQLKYRYDREIDKVERPCLRKIFEQDDVPQKRMVLCVCDIQQVNANTFTLELTDGWYAIKTIVDKPLNQQIMKGKIKIGTKLIISCAELPHCDPCSPLEATDLVTLKINFNCTRRAKWDTRLGYQNIPEPFPIKINTINPEGGLIGLIQICIVRCYPVKFLEKYNDGASVWRNKKSEEKRAQCFENEIIRNMEKEYNNCDVEDQHHCVPSSKLDELKSSTRNVSSGLKLKIIDINDANMTTYNLFVWQPNEWHMTTLKEARCLLAYNILPRKNGDLATTKRTLFKPYKKMFDMDECFKRKLTNIENLFMLNDVKFREFDTVGIVIKIVINHENQFVWLSNLTGSLLLIKIFHPQEYCCLLDNVKENQPITVCNLLYVKFNEAEKICEAVGNFNTIFSLYSQYKHLQEGLEAFKLSLPKDCTRLIEDCFGKIDMYDSLGRSNNKDDSILSDDENTLTSSKLTKTDIALSMMDIDTFNELN